VRQGRGAADPSTDVVALNLIAATPDQDARVIAGDQVALRSRGTANDIVGTRDGYPDLVPKSGAAGGVGPEIIALHQVPRQAQKAVDAGVSASCVAGAAVALLGCCPPDGVVRPADGNAQAVPQRRRAAQVGPDPVALDLVAIAPQGDSRRGVAGDDVAGPGG